jgi:hypothetical protein
MAIPAGRQVVIEMLNFDMIDCPWDKVELATSIQPNILNLCPPTQIQACKFN